MNAHPRLPAYHNPLRALVLAILAALAGTAAVAEEVTLRFTGTTWSIGADMMPYFSSGDTFTFTLSYDTETAARYAGEYSQQYYVNSAFFSVDATEGAWSTALNNTEIQIDHGPDYSQFHVTLGAGYSFSNPNVDGKTLETWNLRLYSDNANIFTGFDLPTGLTWSDWSPYGSYSQISMGFRNPGDDYGSTGNQLVKFIFTDIQKVSAVPEPSAYALIGGLCALGGVLWRRRRTRQIATTR